MDSSVQSQADKKIKLSEKSKTKQDKRTAKHIMVLKEKLNQVMPLIHDPKAKKLLEEIAKEAAKI